MIRYSVEATTKSLMGSVTCGSRCGYDGEKEFTLGETLDIIDAINRAIGGAGLQPIPCVVHEGVLVGRAGGDGCREKVFTMDFKWSPRSAAMESDVFHKTLMEYATRLGERMKQERVYVEFDDKTEVLKGTTRHQARRCGWRIYARTQVGLPEAAP